MSDATRAEVCAVAIADLFRGDGEILASSFGTVPALGARLAKLTFEPDLMMSDGIAYLRSDIPPLGGEAGDGAVVEGWLPFRAADVKWEHEHCEFCWAKFMDPTYSDEHRQHIAQNPEILTEGYTTDEEGGPSRSDCWICPKCFDDFREQLHGLYHFLAVEHVIGRGQLAIDLAENASRDRGDNQRLGRRGF